jgi:hypothetical protein
MKKIPESNLEWAKEAYEALCFAHILFKDDYETPTKKEKLELFSYAVPSAGKNRGVTNSNELEKATDYIYSKLSHDINPIEVGEKIHYSIWFLVAYLEAHVVFDMLPEDRVQEIMDVLDANYAIDIPA